MPTAIGTVLPCADIVPMLVRALLPSGQIMMRRIDERHTLSEPIRPFVLDRAA